MSDEHHKDKDSIDPSEKLKEQKESGEPIQSTDHGPGGIRMGNAKIPPFLMITYVVLALWAFGYAFTAVPLNQVSEASADGEAIFQQSCLGCHNVTNEPSVGPGLEGVSERYDNEELQEILVNGIGEMPSLPALGLNTEQIKAVKEYILEL
ncbi:c-type cytochrome [Alteribacter aurantiacus]|uniref:c-type cytochrome n=1 Tax=Alteribacter aurantiacus TaxID=254410 RepID=UPI0003FFC208|nr:cytochrome c [Alteribacter aurantiacus]